MEVNLEYLVGDEVIVKTSKLKGKIVQRKVTITDTGFKTYFIEMYQIKYVTRPYQPLEWVNVDRIELDKVNNELSDEYGVLSVIIDVNLLQGYRNDEMVKMYNEMRNTL